MSACMRERKPNPLPLDQRLGLTVTHTAQVLDCGDLKVWDLIRKKKLSTVDVDGMTRVTGESLRALVAGSQKEAD